MADILGQPHHEDRDPRVPRVTFTDPEIGSVGLTEHRPERGLAVRTGRAPIRSPPAAGSAVGNDGYIKLVEDTGRACWPGRPAEASAGGRC